MGQEELVISIDKAHWPKNVLRVLSPLLRKLGDSHGHLIVAAQPARGVILLQGPGEKISLALPGLRQLVAEHFPDAEVPKELLTPCEQAAAAPEEEEAKSPASEPDVEMVKAERAAADTPQELAAKALRRAYATRSASAMRIALGAACAARVAPAHLEEGERWLRELQAGAALGDALASGEVPELQRALNAARVAQVPEERLDEAELQLGRLQAEQNLQEALAGSEAELREALAQARALGAEALEAAEAALCTKAAEAELLAAMELVGGLQAADEETELVFGSAVREAHSAGVVGPTLAQAEAKLQALRDARQAAAAQSTKRPADENAAENDAGEPPAKRQRSETEGEEGVEGVEAWARCLLEAAVLRCCKRRAIEAEDFDLALLLKQQEPLVAGRLEKAKEAAKAQAPREVDVAKLEEVRTRKQQAVEEEDYDQAQELKDLEARLCGRQLEESHGTSAALRLLSRASPEELGAGLCPVLAEQAASCRDLWRQVRAVLAE